MAFCLLVHATFKLLEECFRTFVSTLPTVHPCGLACCVMQRRSLQHTSCWCTQSFESTDYGAEIDLSTQMDLSSTSLTCIPARHCEPLGGYSAWASLPPLSNASRRQIIVLAHWDSIGLFRSQGSRVNVRLERER